MPEPRTETNESSSTVLSCDNSSQDVVNSNHNAKYSNESKLPTSPPPLLFDDARVEKSASTESNDKSDNSSVNLQVVAALTNCEPEPDSIGKICPSRYEMGDSEDVPSSPKPNLQTSSTSCENQKTSSGQDQSNFCSSSITMPEENSQQSSSTHYARNISYQPSFSDLQDEYLHQICSQIGSNIQSDAFVPDIVTHNVPGNVDGKLCVIHPQTFQGADSLLSMNKPTMPHLSPHDKSAWSSTSSISTRPNTDNLSSMSKFTTRFGFSGRSTHDGNIGAHETAASESKEYNERKDNKSNLEMKHLSSSPRNTSAEVSRTKKDIVAFKSTAV